MAAVVARAPGGVMVVMVMPLVPESRPPPLSTVSWLLMMVAPVYWALPVMIRRPLLAAVEPRTVRPAAVLAMPALISRSSVASESVTVTVRTTAPKLSVPAIVAGGEAG